MRDKELTAIRDSLLWSIRCSTTVMTEVVLAVWADGGQLSARRNAWSAMVDGNARARERSDAERAMAEGALASQPHTGAQPVSAVRPA